MAVKWIEARQKKSADPPWTSKVTLIVDEFIELETAFESASGAHRETVMVAGKILAVSPPTQHGIMLELSFIGSDDPETADKMKDSNVNFHLCQLKPRQDGCKVTTDGVLHSEKFRKLSINEVRALGYAPKAVLDELAPPPPSSKQSSISAALSHRMPSGGGPPPVKKAREEAPATPRPGAAPRFDSLAGLAAGMKLKPPKKKKKKKKKKDHDSSSSSDSSDSSSSEWDDPGSPLKARKTLPTEIHRKQPGRLAFEVVVAQVSAELAEDDEFKPVMHKRTLSVLRLLQVDPEKHKSSCREMLTTARAMDHIIKMIIEMQKSKEQKSFDPSAPNVEIWRGLDVMAQRWAALEYILTKQMQEPGIPIAKVWTSLKTFELEPPIAMTTIRGDRLQAAQSQAATESKLFGALGNTKKD